MHLQAFPPRPSAPAQKPPPPQTRVATPQVEAFPLAGMFGLCVAFMVVSLISQVQMDRLSAGKHLYHKVSGADEVAAAQGGKAEAGVGGS